MELKPNPCTSQYLEALKLFWLNSHTVWKAKIFHSWFCGFLLVCRKIKTGEGNVGILIRYFIPLNMEGINVASVTRLCISIVTCTDLKATIGVIILSVFCTQIHLFWLINQSHLVI